MESSKKAEVSMTDDTGIMDLSKEKKTGKEKKMKWEEKVVIEDYAVLKGEGVHSREVAQDKNEKE